jgi:hypothetical protein
MPGGSLDVVVKFLADASAINHEVDKLATKTGSKIKSFAKGAAAALGTVFVAKQVGDWIDQAQEADKVNAKLEKSMKNAGDATGAWAKHAEDLADSMQRKIGVDDEVIKSAQTILTTFHGISGTLKDQPDLFDRATKAAADLSSAGFGDMSSTAKALGKALEDPQKGLTALQRMGVKFTEAEKEQIKQMIDAGDKAGAYGIILGKVEGKVGGVAEASATAGDKMKVAWGEATESLGRAFIPVMQAATPLIEAFSGFLEKNAAWLVPVAGGIIAVVIALKLWIGAQTLLNGLLATFGVEIAVPTALVFGIALAVLAAYAAVVLLYAKWDQVWTWIGNLPWYAKVAILVFAVTNPVLLLILAVAALAVYWSEVWSVIGPIVKAGAQYAIGWINDLVDALGRIVDMAGKAANALEKLSPFSGGGSGSDLQKAGRGTTSSGGFKIPRFASGGIVTRPTLALIAEAGPEAVVPLRQTGTLPGLGGTVNIYVTTTGLGADSAQIQSGIVTALRNYTARNGPI